MEKIEMDIPLFTKKIFDDFDKMRGKQVGKEFWDIVVVTASDEAQAHAYRQQIASKKLKNELPLGVEYPVYFDPPGPKVGCGGSTMYVIGELYEQYGEQLWTKRILLLNAGGQSQRLPSSSILGKIFMALPIRDPMYQIFEIKLASYLPLLKNMKPGFFHSPADTVEVYDLGNDGDHISFDKPGFTALAHPSNLDIGRTHGVYVLEEGNENDTKIASMKNCLEVLQKPSIERMRERGAILQDFEGKEIAYTDSCFFFDHDVSKKLMEFYKREPINCEIDGYGDFLQCLGPRATDSYTMDLKNVSKVEPSLVETRKKVYELLKDTPLSVVLLKASKFYHFGTMPEYIENLTDDPVVASELGYQQEAFSYVAKSSSPNADFQNGDTDDGVQIKRRKVSHDIEGYLMQCVLESSKITIGNNSVLEYCCFKSPVHISPNCIISNCQVVESNDVLNIPCNTFIHTAWISHNGKSKAVTFTTGVKDNIKKKTSIDNLTDLLMFGKSFSTVVKSAGLTGTLFKDETACSLWTAKIFPAGDSMTESFLAAYSMYFSGKDDEGKSKGKELFSLEEVVKYKDVDKMLSYRNELYKDIKGHKQS